ncbi:helix-turn-helix domain-containing protein [Streptomyces lavendofoliae]|uniref:HTH cro/C1-type domain-containing protein n=1 Tax=Streptomyces lavendofoliae TaxID=67314 RepID=A0A918M5M0_9ACTN|nr:helix-turn-helix transcriptional regulator [Streptomyces lavendofoliae]GGU50381.1 hypothetical protein GCM10010274_43870 [Streptomyces lavendofoliae]
MDTPPEDLAALVKHIKETYDVSDSEIARRIDVHVSTVNKWVNHKRAGGRGPHPDKLRRLAEAFPKFTVEQVFAAAGRKVPGPLGPDAETRLLALFAELTSEQQETFEIQMRAVAEHNHQS